MFDFVTPSLLWGTAAVGAPILIHLLMRQRPRPTPWAAMRWLRAAIQVAQRRYKLTNLLLLLLRCLVLVLLAMALARPSLAGIGTGGNLVIVLDRTASMGPLVEGGGALNAALGALEQHGIVHRSITIVAIDEGVELRRATSAKEALDILRTLQASTAPGGVDRAAEDEHTTTLLAACDGESDVVVISDFRQDQGQRLAALLQERVRSFRRWRVADGDANGLVTGITGLSDLVPGLPGELLLGIEGDITGAKLAVDDGQALERELTVSDGRARLDLPPMDAGSHRLRIELLDGGLRYDNILELPVEVRATVGVVLAENERSTIGAALLADSHRLDTRIETPTTLFDRPLPDAGLVALRQPVLTGGRDLAGWVTDGGVLWAPLSVLQQSPGLDGLVSELTSAGESDGGQLHSTWTELNANLGRSAITTLPRLSLPAGTDIHLQAGDDPLVVEVPIGRGRLLIEAVAIEQIDDLAGRPAWPLWVRKLARSVTAELAQPDLIEAGRPALADRTVRRQGREEKLVAGEPVILTPGLWKPADLGGPLVVLPSRDEGRLHLPPAADTVDQVGDALPDKPGFNWGPLLLALMLAVLIGEGALAAWAGRTYGT